MNGYLRSKCSSEQQLLNELAKLLGAKDVASRKMGDVLRALTFFYTSAARGSRIPQSLLSGLCALLPQLKDKKEIVLLKDEHQRIARIALCLLARLTDQFEVQKERLTDSHLTLQNGDPTEQVLTNFLSTLETAVMTPPGLLLPRQRASLRVYAQLCRILRKREQLVSFTATLLQQSPVLAENRVDAKGKRAPPPGPAQLGAVAGACHALRFHAVPDEQIFTLDKLAQLAFTVPAGTASRHSAKTLLSILTSTTLNNDQPSNAVTTAKAIELFLIKTRPRSLLGGDSLTSVLLLRLCGHMYRLPVHQQQQGAAVLNEAGGSILDAKMLETSPGSGQPHSSDQNPALQGFFVSNALSAQLQEYLVGVIQSGIADGESARSTVAPAVLLVAVEEALRGTAPVASFVKHPEWGSKCIFELVAAALLSLLSAPTETAKSAGNTVMLHRVCRAVQFVAERLDATVLQLNASSGQSTASPIYLSQLTLRIRPLVEHNNAFVACGAWRALVWLLPRCGRNSGENTNTVNDEWTSLFCQLQSLPFNRIQPERRAAIAWTLFRRGVSTPKLNGYAVETPLLSGCLHVVLAWFRVRPCVWHAVLLTAAWHTALHECLAPLGGAVFSSINELLDFQCTPTDSAAADSLVVKQSALQFLSHKEGGMQYAARNETWSHPLILRLTKQALLETCTSQRLSARALSQLRDEAKLQGLTPLTQQVDAILCFVQKTSRQSRQTSTISGGGSEKQPFGFHDDDPFADVTAHEAAPVSAFPNFGSENNMDKMLQANDDPFSDFRSPEEIAPSTNGSVAVESPRILDDPFADAVRTNSATTFNWNDPGSVDKAVNYATENTAFSTFNTADERSFVSTSWGEDGTDDSSENATTKALTFSSPAAPMFTNWGDDDKTLKDQQQDGNTKVKSFGNFSTTETESAFSGWGESTAKETYQGGFSTDAVSFGDFDIPNSTGGFTSWPESDLHSTQNSSFTNTDTSVDIARTVEDGAAETVPAGTLTGRTEFFSVEMQHTTTATTATTSEEASFSTDLGAPADFNTPADFSTPAEEVPAFDGGVRAEQQGDFGGEAEPVFGEPAAVKGGAADTVADRTESFSAETQHTTTATTATTSEEASFSTDLGAPADFNTPADFSTPAEEVPAFDGGVRAEQQGDFGGEAEPVFGEPAAVKGGAADTVADRTESFSAETQHTTTATTATTSEEASFSTDLGAPADFNTPADFSTPAEEVPAFDGGVRAEQQGDFGGEAEPVFGEPAAVKGGAADTVADRTESFSAETQHTTTATTATTSEEASFSTDLGAPADFNTPADFSTPAEEVPAFDGGVRAEQQGDFGGEAEPVFGEPAAVKGGAADTVADRTESFSAETQHTTTATTATTSEEASFSTDLGAPADFNTPADFSTPAEEVPAFDGGVRAEQQGDFGGEAEPVFGEPAAVKGGAADTVADRTESFSAETQHTTTATTATTSEEASFSTDLGAPADFNTPADFSTPAEEVPAFDGGVRAEQQGDFGGEAEPVFGEPAAVKGGAADTVADRTESFSAETQHTTTATTATTSEEASFSTDLGAPADFNTPADFSTPAEEVPAFDGGVRAEQQGDFGGEAEPVFGEPAAVKGGAADTVADRTESFSAETQHTTTATTATTSEEASFSTVLGAPADFNTPADFSTPAEEVPAFDGGVRAEQQGDFGGEAEPVFGEPAAVKGGAADTVADRTESFSAETQHTTTATTATTSEEASFSTDLGAPADFNTPADFSTPAEEVPAFDGGVRAEQQGDFGGEAEPVFGEPAAVKGGAADTVADRTESFSAETQHTTTATTATTSEEASFSTDLGAPADFNTPADFSTPAEEVPAFDGGVRAEQQGDFGGEAEPVFGEPAAVKGGAADTVADRTESFSAETQHTTTATTATTSEEASFSTDLGAPADFNTPADFSTPAEEVPAFDGGVRAEQQGDFGGEAEPVFGEPAAVKGGAADTVADRTESFSAETQHTTTATTATTSEEASFSTDLGAPADFNTPADFSTPAEEVPAFDGGVRAEQQGDFGGEAEPVFGEPAAVKGGAADTVADRTESFSAETQHTTTATTATTSEEASFSTDLGAPADFNTPADFSTPAEEVPAFDGGVRAEQQGDFGGEAEPVFGEPAAVIGGAADMVADRTESFSAETQHTTTATTATTSEEASFSTDLGAPADFNTPADFSTPAEEVPAFDGGVRAEQQGDFGGEAEPVFGEPAVVKGGAAGTVADRTESFSAETQHTTTATTATTSEEASFSTDLGAPADFNTPADFSTPAEEVPAFDGGVRAEQQGDFGGEAEPVFGEPAAVIGGAADTVADRTESFSAETQHTTTATTATTSEEASFSTDLGAPADFNTPADFSTPAEEVPAFDGGVRAEQQGDFGGEAEPVFGEPAAVKGGAADTVADRTESFSAETQHTTTATTATTSEEASFSTVLGAPADFNTPADFSTPAEEVPAFDGGVRAEQQGDFGGEAEPVFGEPAAVKGGAADTVADRTESFSAETQHTTTATTATTSEEASFSTDLGAPADFNTPADFSTPAEEVPAFDGGVRAEQQGDFGGEAEPVFGEPAAVKGGAADTVADRTESFSAETQHTTTATTATTSEEASFSTDLGAPADFNTPADFSTPAEEVPAFDGGVRAEQQGDFGGEAEPVFGEPAAVKGGAADTVADRTESFSAETQHTTTATTATTSEEASFSTDLGAPADFNTPADFSTPAEEVPAFDGGVRAEQQGDFGGEAEPVFGEPAAVKGGAADTVADRTESFSAETQHTTTATTATTSEEASFSTVLGAPADFNTPADFSTPAEEVPAFDGGVRAEQQGDFGGEAEPVFGEPAAVKGGAADMVADRTESFSAETQHTTTATTATTSEEASFSTDLGAPADFNTPADFSTPAEEVPAFDGGVRAEQQGDFGGEAEPVFGEPAAVKGGAADTVADRTESFSAETQHTTTATTATTSEEASFSTVLGAPADFNTPADFSTPAEEVPAFDGGVRAEQQGDFGGEAEPVFGEPAAVKGGAADTVADRTESFSAETQHTTTATAATPSTFEEGFVSSGVIRVTSDEDIGSLGLDVDELGTIDLGESDENKGTGVDAVSIAGGNFTFDEHVNEYNDDRNEAQEYFSDAKELGASIVVDTAVNVSEKQSTDVRVDDDAFDEIFGDTPTTQTESVSAAGVTSGKYDADFDDIFGESQIESTNVNLEAFSEHNDLAVSTDGAPMAKKHSTLENEEDHTASELEVRTGTPASEFTFS